MDEPSGASIFLHEVETQGAVAGHEEELFDHRVTCEQLPLNAEQPYGHSMPGTRSNSARS